MPPLPAKNIIPTKEDKPTIGEPVQFGTRFTSALMARLSNTDAKKLPAPAPPKVETPDKPVINFRASLAAAMLAKLDNTVKVEIKPSQPEEPKKKSIFQQNLAIAMQAKLKKLTSDTTLTENVTGPADVSPVVLAPSINPLLNLTSAQPSELNLTANVQNLPSFTPDAKDRPHSEIGSFASVPVVPVQGGFQTLTF